MGIIIAVWLSRLDSAILLKLVTVTWWIILLLRLQSPNPADLYQVGEADPERRWYRLPAAPGLW